MNDVNDPALSALHARSDASTDSSAALALARLRERMEQAVQEAHDPGAAAQVKDAGAIAALDPKTHPVTRYLHESAPGKTSQVHARNRVKSVYRMLTGHEGPVVEEAYLTYPWHLLAGSDVERFEEALSARGYKPASRNSYRATLRALIRNCRRAGLVSNHACEHLLDQLAGERFTRPPTGRLVPADELSQLMSALAHKDAWRMSRDRAILAVLATTGLRISEVCSIKLAALDMATGWIGVDMTKNGTPHRVPVATGAVPYLESWLQERGEEDGYLFISRRSHHAIEMSPHVVKGLLSRATEAAGLPHCTAHDFRRTVATHLLRTHDASVVMKLLNHKSLNSTLVYDRAPEELQAKAVDSLPIPLMSPPDEVPS